MHLARNHSEDLLDGRRRSPVHLETWKDRRGVSICPSKFSVRDEDEMRGRGPLAAAA